MNWTKIYVYGYLAVSRARAFFIWKRYYDLHWWNRGIYFSLLTLYGWVFVVICLLLSLSTRLVQSVEGEMYVFIFIRCTCAAFFGVLTEYVCFSIKSGWTCGLIKSKENSNQFKSKENSNQFETKEASWELPRVKPNFLEE